MTSYEQEIAALKDIIAEWQADHGREQAEWQDERESMGQQLAEAQQEAIAAYERGVCVGQEVAPIAHQLEVEHLRGELASKDTLFAEAVAAFDAQIAAAAEMVGRLEQERDALRPYAQHMPHCAVSAWEWEEIPVLAGWIVTSGAGAVTQLEPARPACDCGFVALTTP